MEFPDELRELVEQTGRVAVNWDRGRLEVLAIGDLDDDGELDSVPVTASMVRAQAQAIVDGIVGDHGNASRLHLTLTPPGNVDGGGFQVGGGRPLRVML